jgi:Phosphoribosylanthranilate isomerase
LISSELSKKIKKVGVFVNHSKDYIDSVVADCQLDMIQLHGDESPEFCSGFSCPVMKAVRIKSESDLLELDNYKDGVDYFLLDTKVPGHYGGTGTTFDWELAVKAKAYNVPIFLSGGIGLDNISQAISTVDPYAIDLSSSVELKPGIKDHGKLNAVVDRFFSV